MDEYKERLAKTQKEGIMYVLVLAASGFIAGKVVQYFAGSVVCAAFSGVGVFFLFMMLHGFWLAKQYRKTGMPAYATVVECEKVRAEHAEFREYYVNTYQVYCNGGCFMLKYPEYKKLEVGTTMNGYYIPKKEILCTEKEMRSFESGKALKVMVIVCALLAVVSVFVERYGKNFFIEFVSNEGVKTAFFWVMTVILWSSGIRELSVGIQRRKERAQCWKFPARLVNYHEERKRDRDDKDWRYVYYPIWEYQYGDETKWYKGAASRRRKQAIGAVGTLYLNQAGFMYEESEKNRDFIAGLVFCLLGFLLLGTRFLW